MPNSQDDPPITLVNRSSGSLLEYIKVLVWPLFAALILVSFWRSLHDMVSVFPSLLSQAESIEFKGMVFKVGKRAAAQASPEVRSALNNLTSNDIRELLETGGGTILFDKPDDENAQAKVMEVWKHFIQLGLATELSKSELDAKSREDRANYKFGLRTNDEYQKVRDLALD